MSYLFFWTGLALACDWWAGSPAARPGWRFLIATVALAGGLAVGLALRVWLPGPGPELLGTGALTYLGVFALAEAWGAFLPSVEERDGRVSRTFLAATGVALITATEPVGLFWLLVGTGGGLVAGRAATKERRLIRRLRLASGLILCALGLVTFRGLT